MQITRLKLAGFKSFAEPTEVLIQPGLTGVVGPNGCGKSNIVDAVRWVMGESSARGLRGDEMEDVIFAGSDARATFDFAEVALVLEAAADSGGNGVEVLRRLGRGVGSTFRMNGREARARDVQRLLADSAAGARSASIVGQGQIGALVEARPHERQRLLADAAGIAGLQSRRREAELRLDAAASNLKTLGERETTLAEQAGRLEKQTREAQRWRAVNQRHREVQVLSLLARFAAAERACERARTELEAAEVGLTEAAAEARAAALAAAEAASGLGPLRVEEQRIAAQRARLEERLQMRRGEADAMRAAMERSKVRGQELAADLARETEAAEAAAATITAIEVERQAAPGEAARLEAELARMQTVLTAADGRLDAATTAWRDAERDYSRAAEEAAQASRRIEAAEARMDALQRQADAVATEIAAIEAAATDTQPPPAVARHAAAMEALRAIEKERASAAQGVEMALLRRAEAAARLADARAAVDGAAATDRHHRELLERRDELEAQLATIDARRAEATRASAEAAAALEALDVGASQAELARVQEDADVARRAVGEAHAERVEAVRARSAAAEAVALARTDQARVEAELDALGAPPAESLTPAITPEHLPSELHAAVADALGDDVLAPVDAAAPERWQSPGPLALHALPEGARALGDMVEAPKALAARLAQIGVVEDVAAAQRLVVALRPGQRLTTPAGGLWRWDGYCRVPGAAAQPNDRLARELRRSVLAERAGDASSAVGQAITALSTADTHLAAATAKVAAAEEAVEATREAQFRAQAALERGEAQSRRLGEAKAAAEAALAMLDAERGRLDERSAVVSGAFDALPVADAIAAELAAARQALEAAEAESEDAQAAVAGEQGTLGEADASLSDARRTAEAAEGEATKASAEQAAAERAALQRLAALAERQRALAAQIADAEPEREEAQSVVGPLTAARDTALRTVEQALGEVDAARQARDAGAADVLAAEAAIRSAAEVATLGQQRFEAARHQLASSRDKLAELRRRQEALAAEQASLADPETLVAALEGLGAEVAELERTGADAAAARADAERAAEAAAERQRRTEALAAAAVERCEGLKRRAETAQAQLAAAETAGRDRLKSAPGSLLEDATLRAEADAADPEALEHELVRLEAQRERLGAVNLRADDELEELRRELEELGTERGDLDRAVGELRRAIAELNREGRSRILEAFRAVEQHFGQLFQRLFGGGRAELRLAEDPDDPLGAGLELGASPPGKRLQALSLLSGGEKALTAIALIFAFFRTQPAPLCVLDEVDAPLDDANVARLGDLMAEMAETTGTRFLVVTHHPLTMARMHRLYGVTMIERGLSSLVGVELEAALALRDTG